LKDLFFYLFQTTSDISNGLPSFIEADIVNIKFTKKDFYKLYFFANQQMGFADLFHLISANRLGCKYFFTFDSDYEQCKEEVKEQFDLIVIKDIHEMVRLIRK
jgi:hypothetical protein